MGHKNIWTLIVKLLLVSVPVAALAAAFLLDAESPTSLQKKGFENKVQQLVTPTSPHVIIAGESRAMYNVIPEIFSGKTGLSSVNIATGYETLDQVYDELSKNQDLNRHRLIVVSISSYEINDAVYDNHADYVDLIQQEPLGMRKLNFMRIYLENQALFYFDHFKKFVRRESRDRGALASATLQKKGYVENPGVFLSPPADAVPQREVWYADVETGGLKEKNFTRAIENFGTLNDTVVLYMGPVAPGWWHPLERTNAPKVEEHFRDVIKKAAAPFRNIHVIDFHVGENRLEFPDGYFSDSVHLNNAGAPIFTELLVQELRKEKTIK